MLSKWRDDGTSIFPWLARNVIPLANDGNSLGISGTAWSDVFLAAGAVINFNAGNVTITHSASTLTFDGGNIYIFGGPMRFEGTTALIATEHEIGRNAAGQLEYNVPSTIGHLFSVNGVNLVSFDSAGTVGILAPAVGSGALTLTANAGARTAALSTVTLNGTAGAAAGGTLFDINVTQTGAGANPLFDIDVTALYTGNIFEVDIGAVAYTGEILSLDLGATSLTGMIARFMAGSALRTTALVTIDDAGTSTGIGLDLNKTGGPYSATEGYVDIVHSGIFTGADTTTGRDFRIAPSFTVTEPGAGTFTFYGADIDLSGILVTAGAGTTLFAALRLAANADADVGTNLALFVDQGLSRFDDHIIWGAGTAVTAGNYSIGRDADATNQIHINSPAGAGLEMSIGDVPMITLGGTGAVLTKTFATAGTMNTIVTAHTSDTAGSGTMFQLVVAGASAGDAFTHFQVGGVTDWTIGLDNSDSDALVISNSATLGTLNRMRIPTTGAVTITGGANFGQQDLTNYTEATFTPTVTLVGGAGNTVPVYVTNTGRYTRVGRQVFAEVYLTGDGGAEGAGTGTFNVALPVTASASNPTSYFPTGIFANGTAEDPVWGQIVGGGTTIELVYEDVLNNLVAMTGAEQSSTTRTVRLKFFYEV